MRLKIRNQKDLLAGLLFVCFGVGFMIVARNYPMGNAVRMGPGYFPSILGGSLALLGLAVTLRAFWLEGEGVKRIIWRPLLLVIGAVVAFSLLVEPLGLVLATLALIFMSCLGGWDFRMVEVTLLFIFLAALAAGVFVYTLGLPFKVWPV